MTLMKFNRSHDDFFPSLSRMFEDFAPVSRTSMPAVNVKETEEAFEVELAAPGLKKDDFEISLDDNVLQISAEKEVKHEEGDESTRYSRREFSYQSFARSFTLPETVNQEEIAANYEDGVLKIKLPKLDEAQVKQARTIAIS